tara:strand:- start:341 stop:727 length:387 start_codon:yes stop_codon:yes gene_type:complete
VPRLCSCGDTDLALRGVQAVDFDRLGSSAAGCCLCGWGCAAAAFSAAKPPSAAKPGARASAVFAAGLLTGLELCVATGGAAACGGGGGFSSAGAACGDRPLAMNASQVARLFAAIIVSLSLSAASCAV